MNATDLTIRAYLRAFFADWVTGMCGPFSVPFAAAAVWANAQYAKILWGCLAALCFFIASYRVWRKERMAAHDESLRTDDQAEGLRQDQQKEMAALQQKIVLLERKPYNEELERIATEMLNTMTDDGKLLMRHVLQNEPIDLGKQFFLKGIPPYRQQEQLAIALQRQIVRQEPLYFGNGNLNTTNLVVNPQYRQVLQDLLYRRA